MSLVFTVTFYAHFCTSKNRASNYALKTLQCNHFAGFSIIYEKNYHKTNTSETVCLAQNLQLQKNMGC